MERSSKVVADVMVKDEVKVFEKNKEAVTENVNVLAMAGIVEVGIEVAN